MMNEYGKSASRWKVLLQVFIGFLVMLVADLISSVFCDVLFSNIITFSLPRWGYIAIRSIAVILTTYGLLYLYIKKVFKTSMTAFRMGKLRIKLVYMICAFLLPIFVSLCLIATGGTFVDNLHGREGVIGIILIALAYALKAGVIEELIFRGYMMTLLEAKWNKEIAIVVPSVIFGLLHVTSMREFNLISFLLLLVAGTSVGIMFSIVTYENESIWASTLIHTVWNMVMIGGILDISTMYDPNSAFSFVLSSNHSLLTGGAFGIEASVFAVIGYTLIILLSLFLLKRKKINF